MMNLKRIKARQFAVLITSIMLISSIFAQAGFVHADSSKLNDIEESYAKEEIQRLVEDGIIDGYGDGSFRPQNNITRAELAKILTKMLDLETNQSTTSHFEDAGQAWYSSYIDAVYKKGIMVGKSEKLFAPDDNVTREEVAAIFVRIVEMEENEDIEKIEEVIFVLDITDINEISQWALESVTSAIKLGLMEAITNPDGTQTFNPKELADRQLIAKVAYEVKYNIKEKSGLQEQEQVKEEIKTEEQSKEEQNDPVQPTQPSYESIVSKYMAKFSSLQGKYQSSLNSLISKALAEKEAGVSITELAHKYMDLAANLESSADSEFYSVLSSFRSELEEYGYDTSVVDEAESEYISIKSEVESSVLGQL